MRVNLATIAVCLLSSATLLATEPGLLPRSSNNTNQKQPTRINGRNTPLLLVSSAVFGEELWPDETSEHGEYQLVAPKQVFGPPEGEPRKTLFQWSYGTSFEGGIDLEKDAIQTDRPDFVEASTTVGKGVLQIESGYTYTRNKDAGDNSITHTAGEVLMRYGVLQDWLELRLGVFPFSQVLGNPSPAVTNSGVEDLYVGAKIGLTPQEGWWPEMSIVPQMTVPTGHNAVTSNKWLPGINWLYSWEVNDFIKVGGGTQFNGAVDGTTSRKYTEWAQAITINYALTDDVGAYTEWFAFFPSGAGSEQAQHYIDGGFTYQPTLDMQFDIRVGIGLTDASDDYFVGTGFSIRIK